MTIVVLFFILRPKPSNTATLFNQSNAKIENVEIVGELEVSIVDNQTEPVEEVLLEIFVDVQGEVKNPGVIRAHPNDRVGDVIAAAGGLTNDAVTRGLNQAARIYDEMIIFVPNEEEFNQMFDTPDVSVGSSSTSSGLISISRATADQLQTLPGIGPSLSAAIIAYREANGNFNSIEELTNVPGIGGTRFESIRDLIEP